MLFIPWKMMLGSCLCFISNIGHISLLISLFAPQICQLVLLQLGQNLYFATSSIRPLITDIHTHWFAITVTEAWPLQWSMAHFTSCPSSFLPFNPEYLQTSSIWMWPFFTRSLMASSSISTPMHMSQHSGLWLIEGPRTMAVMCHECGTTGSPDGKHVLVIQYKACLFIPGSCCFYMVQGLNTNKPNHWRLHPGLLVKSTKFNHHKYKTQVCGCKMPEATQDL